MLNQDLGRPVQILTDLLHLEVADLVGRAGIYLDTYVDDEAVPFGMPVSIAEAMATGGFVLCRRLNCAAEYVSNPGRLYDSEGMAAELVRSTATWSENDGALPLRHRSAGPIVCIGTMLC